MLQETDLNLDMWIQYVYGLGSIKFYNILTLMLKILIEEKKFIIS